MKFVVTPLLALNPMLKIQYFFCCVCVEEKMEAVNNFITKLFEPATRAVQQLPDKIEVPMDIGNRYKQVMAGYWAAVSETNMSD